MVEVEDHKVHIKMVLLAVRVVVVMDSIVELVVVELRDKVLLVVLVPTLQQLAAAAAVVHQLLVEMVVVHQEVLLVPVVLVPIVLFQAHLRLTQVAAVVEHFRAEQLAPAVLAVVALLAAAWPSMKAAAVQPSEALRHE